MKFKVGDKVAVYTSAERMVGEVFDISESPRYCIQYQSPLSGIVMKYLAHEKQMRKLIKTKVKVSYSDLARAWDLHVSGVKTGTVTGFGSHGNSERFNLFCKELGLK